MIDFIKFYYRRDVLICLFNFIKCLIKPIKPGLILVMTLFYLIQNFL